MRLDLSGKLKLENIFPAFRIVTLLDEGREIRCFVVGRGEPVLLFHGFGVNAWWMLPILIPYLGKRSFYIPEMRGHGGSDFGKEDLVLDLETLLLRDGKKIGDLLSLDFEWVIGHSLGVVSALGYLEKHGKKTTKYLHIDFPLNFSEDLEPIIQDLIRSAKENQPFKSPKVGGNLALLLDAMESDFFRVLTELSALDQEEARLKEKYLEIFKRITILCLPKNGKLRPFVKNIPLKAFQYFVPDYRFLRTFQRSAVWSGLGLKKVAEKFKGETTVMLTNGDGDFSLLNNGVWTIRDLQEGFKDARFIFFNTDSHMFHYDHFFQFQKHFKRFLGV